MVFREGQEYDFEAPYTMWGNEIMVGVNVNIESDYDISSYSERVEKRLMWINKKRHVIELAMLENGMGESAEYWTSNNYARDDDGGYILNDGKKVFLPISDDDFCESLSLSEIAVNFEEDGTADIEMYFACNPDYFDGHCIEILIDNDRNIVCDGISG